MNSRTYIVDDNSNRELVSVSNQNSLDGMSDGEALLGSVFESCDVNNEGKVRVSILIEYLLKEAAADDNKEILGYLDDLSLILDPAGRDVYINCELYQQGVHQWIQNIQSRSSFQEDFEKQEDGIQEESGVNVKQVVYRGRGKSDRNLHNCSNGYNDSSLGMERSFGFQSESSSEWEKSETEIMGRIEELQVTNKKLNEDKSKLQTMVENAEEMNSSLTSEIDKMKKKLKKYEQQIEKNKAEEREFEALKAAVNEYQSTREELTSRATQLEKENQALHKTINEFQKTDISRITAQQFLEDENRELLQKLNEQKQLYAELEVLQDLKQKMVDESSSKSEHMTSFIAELSMANEALKAEKNRLEVDLLESKHEISKLTTMTSPSHGLARQPIHASTPFQKNAPANLQQEMNAELALTNVTGSSTSHSGLQNVESSNEAKSLRNETDESDTSIATASSTDKYSTVAQQIALNFKKKRDMALKHIADLVDMDVELEPAPKKKADNKNWVEDLEVFADKIEGLAVAKQFADKRSDTILDALKKVAVENQVLSDSRAKALQKICDISHSSEEMEQRVAKLVDEITTEKAAKEELRLCKESLSKELSEEQDKNASLKKEIEILKQRKSFISSEKPLFGENEQEQQVHELKRLVHDLETRLHDYTRKIFDLEGVVDNKDAIIAKKCKEIQKIQLSHSAVVSRRDEDLKNIIELFSTGGYMAESKNTDELTFKVVKEKFDEFVAKMRAKLQNMGVRDGPVGSEGNDINSNSYKEATERVYNPHGHIEIETPVEEGSLDSQTQTEPVCFASVCCGTDLGMAELETALVAVALLREIQEDRTVLSDCSSQIGSELDYPLKTETNSADVRVNGRSNSGLASEGNGNESPGSLADLRASYEPLNIGQAEENSQTGDVVIGRTQSSLDSRDELRPEECDGDGNPSVNAPLSGNEDAPRDTDIDSRKTHQNSSKTTQDLKEHRNKPKCLKHRTKKPRFSSSSRKQRVRTESISTDESISFDEDDMSSTDDERKSESQEIESTTESEASMASGSSKRSRRIGISAEPVRLPTWTELRESFKLNQQMLLEEEINSFESVEGSSENNNDVIVEPSNVVLAVAKLRTIEGHRDSIDLVTDRSGNGNEENVADESMEWCYDFSKITTEDDAEIPVRKKRSVSFHLPPDEQLKPISADSMESLPILQPSIKDASTPNTSPTTSYPPKAVTGAMVLPEITSESNVVAIAEARDDAGSPAITPEKEESMKIVRPVPVVQKEEILSIRKLTESDKDLEKKFNNAVLAFRTDQYTLQKRLENQERARDVAETGMEREIRKLADSIKVADSFTVTLEQKESLENLLDHADILRKAGMKVSAQAEQHGCFQQEFKAMKMMEVLINYAEHLRLCIERVNEADDMRMKEMQSPGDSRDGKHPDESEIARRQMKYAFCEKCNGRLTFGEDGPLANEVPIKVEKEKVKPKGPSAFQTLTSSLIRERRKQNEKQLQDVAEKEFEFHEDVVVNKKIVNYAENLTTYIPEGQKTRERRSGCGCLATLFRFFLSLAILSAILFVFANYVEIDLPLVSRNLNDRLKMYGKRFFT